MSSRTFLSLSLKPWSLSFGIHLAFFLALVFIGRNHVLDLTVIDLDFSSSSKISMAQNQPPVDEEWQKPQTVKRSLPPPPLKPQPKPEPAAAPATGPVGPIGDQGVGTYKSIAQVSKIPVFIPKLDLESIYPPAAKRADVEGDVILQVDIDATGAVKRVEVVQGLGYGCDEAALFLVRQSSFIPAYAGNEPVPISFKLPIKFHVNHH